MKQKNSEQTIIVNQAIGRVIAEERIRQKKSQLKFANEFDISSSLLSRIERGKSEPKISSLLIICEGLGLPIPELYRRVKARLPKNYTLIDW